MRILLICKEFPGFAVSGGIGTYAEVMAAAMAKRAHDVHVLCVDGNLPRESSAVDGYTVHTGPYRQVRGIGRPIGLPRAAHWISQAFSVRREYQKLDMRFDVAEAPELYAEAGAIALLHPSLPLVVRMHSGFSQLAVPPHDHGVDFRATVAVENFAVKRADMVTSTAPNLSERMQDLHLDPARTRAIIYPVPERPLAAPPGDSNLILFVGRLERTKRPELLIDAMPSVLRANPNARLRLVGSNTLDPQRGSYREFLERRTHDLGVTAAVEFGEAVPQSMVQEEMARAAVCAFPSVRETFGLVAAEAGAIGRPVVVADNPGYRDFIQHEHSGYVVSQADGDGWAAMLLRALEHPNESQALATRLRASLRERASPSAVTDQTLEVYKAAMARHARR